MSQLFTLPKQVAVNASGQPYANATATFYRAGTSTPLTVYSTPDLANPHSNPVVADAAGMFPAIWLDDLSVYQYRVVVHDANGTQLMDESLSGSLSSSSGNVVMDAPSSGNTLTVNQTGGLTYEGISIKSQAGVGNMASLYLWADGVRAHRLCVTTDAGTFEWRDVTAGVNRLTLNSTGQWTYRTPNGSTGVSATDGTLSHAISYLDSTTVYSGTLSAHSYGTMTSGVVRILTTAAGATTVDDGSGNFYPIGYSDIPTASSGFPPGKCREVTAGVTINTSDLYDGKTFAIYNNSASPVTITAGGGVTMRLLGTASTGNRTLSAYGLASFRARSTSEVGGAGAGLS